MRTYLTPKCFRPEELCAFDAPTPGAFVMERVGGANGEDPESNGNGEESGLETTQTPSDAESAIDDTLEVGESNELRSQS